MSRPITALLMGLVKAYRLLLSPHMGHACRFTPTCSRYALQALDIHGSAQGSYLTIRRLARCHPWCEGGYDPVPLSSPTRHALFGAKPCSSTEKKST